MEDSELQEPVVSK